MSETGKGDQLEVQHCTMTSWQNSTVIICTYSIDSMPAPKSFRLSSSGWVSRSATSTKPSTCGDSCAHTQCYRLVIVRGNLRRDVHDGVQGCQGAAAIVDDLAYTSALLSVFTFVIQQRLTYLVREPYSTLQRVDLDAIAAPAFLPSDILEQEDECVYRLECLQSSAIQGVEIVLEEQHISFMYLHLELNEDSPLVVP